MDELNPTTLEIVATALFAAAILHTFSVKRFEHLATRYPPGSVGENLFHVLGEVEVVFGFWAGLFIIALATLGGGDTAVAYLEGRLEHHVVHYTEPIFVFAIMTVAATRPVIQLANTLISAVARLVPLPRSVSFFAVALVLGPLLGSFITEPAAMTVTALVLKAHYYDKGMSPKLMYATLGVLFVNVSIGGTLTHFAAPPVLMVAGRWEWGIGHMMLHFGWKAAIAVVINTVALVMLFGRELVRMGERAADMPGGEAIEEDPRPPVPGWVIVLHMVFLAGIVVFAHHVVVFMGFFLFFLGVVAVTEEYQDELKLKEALLVGFFLAGLVTLGGYQQWWLQPTLSRMGDITLFLGATGLTAFTDNAALTYLGSLVEGLSDASKYALVAGAVTGGGLTVIANAPNPAGFGILKSSFGAEGISPLGLLLAALGPTVVAAVCFWFLPSYGA